MWLGLRSYDLHLRIVVVVVSKLLLCPARALAIMLRQLSRVAPPWMIMFSFT